MPYQCQRLLVKGGITCCWQTRNNRDAITFDEWVDLGLCDKQRFDLGSPYCLCNKVG